MNEKIISDWVDESLMYDQELQDPFISESQGGKLVYLNEHNFIIKIQQKPQVIQTLKDTQLLTVKIAIDYEHQAPKNLKIELTSDTQIYFNFVFKCNDWEFKRIKANENYFIEFREYPDMILKNFARLNESDKYFAVFTIFSQTEGKLNIIRRTEFKDDSIMEFDFVKAKDEVIRKSIQYRYDLMSKKQEAFLKKYQTISEVIRAKNPSLMIQINKLVKKKP